MTLEEMMRDLIASGLVPEPQETVVKAEPDNYLYFPIATAYGVPMASRNRPIARCSRCMARISEPTNDHQ